MSGNLGKNIIKNLSSKYGQELLDNAKQFATDALKKRKSQENQFKKQEKQLVTKLIIKLLIKLKNPKKSHNRILQRKLKVQKYQNAIYLQKKQKKIIGDLRII